MTNILNILLNSSYAALIFFAAGAALASAVVKSPLLRVAAGIVVVAAALCIPISVRSLFEWLVSTVERPSFPGFVLLAALSVSAVTGWHIEASSEFRFATAVLAIAGLVLYPSATGYIDFDTYTFGYSGYVLPTAVAAIIAYTLFRGYLITAFALNVAIAAFLLHLGVSRNLWDYVMDTIACILGCGTWIALAVHFLITRLRRAFRITSAVQPSSGIGETPISH
jgi:hypothetical protein